MSEQQQQQQSRIFKPTETEITPKLISLFENIDTLINEYVVNTGEYSLEKVQRFVGWHVCQNFYQTFCYAFAPPAESRSTAWNIFQRDEYAKYCNEQQMKNLPIETYSYMQRIFSARFKDIKANDPAYHRQLMESAKEANAKHPRNLDVDERGKAFLRDIKSLSTSLKYMHFNYDMHYILLMSHVAKKTKVFSKRVITSKGGAEDAFREIEVELDGMKLLDCFNNKVYEASGRQAAENAMRIAAAASASSSIEAEDERENALEGNVVEEGDDGEFIPERDEEDGQTREERLDEDFIPGANQDDDSMITAEGIEISSIAIPRIVRGVTAINPSDMPLQSMSTIPAPFNPSSIAFDTDNIRINSERPKVKLSKIKNDLRLVLIERYNKAMKTTRKNFPWKIFSGPNATHEFRGWKWDTQPTSFEEIDETIMAELLEKLNKQEIKIRQGRSSLKAFKKLAQ
ncbi:unnamed protein product [Mucor circinelloides]